jgi:polyhydroxyalkanoate synthesis repressor PhaR
MIRVIKRYGGGSRKLYDTEESRYISLREMAEWIRSGQELRVLDSRTDEDVTAQALAQVISEGERHGGSLLSSEFLHDLIRRGSTAVASSVEQLVRLSTEQVGAVRDARQEMKELRRGLRSLGRSVAALERRHRTGRSRRTSTAHPKVR